MKNIKTTPTATLLAAIAGIGALTMIATPHVSAQGVTLLGVQSENVTYNVSKKPTIEKLLLNLTAPLEDRATYWPASRAEGDAFYISAHDKQRDVTGKPHGQDEDFGDLFERRPVNPL